MAQVIRDYEPVPTGLKFHESDKLIRIIIGPIGSGKSVTCTQEIGILAEEQWPNSDGIRKTKPVLIRNTYKELESTTLFTFKQWYPPQISTVVGKPPIATVSYGLPDKTTVHMQVLFLALDTIEDTSKLLSLEISSAFLNEAREIPYAIVTAARERIGRYPSEIDGYTDMVYDTPPEWAVEAHKNGMAYPNGDPVISCTKGVYKYHGPKRLDENGNIEISVETGKELYRACRRKSLILDSNMCDDENFLYHLDVNGHLPNTENPEAAKKETQKIFEFFRQPGGLIHRENGDYDPNPDAENIDHLDGGFQYYIDMIAGNTTEHMLVMVCAQYGALFDGKPVYSDYGHVMHCPAEGVEATEGYPLCLGWDFGHTPACAIGQLINGQMRVIAEVWSDDADTKRFARDHVKPFLQKHFHGFRVGFSFGDPAGSTRGEGEGKSSIGILNDKYVAVGETPLAMGFTTRPAPHNNDPTLRRNAVNSFLLGMRSGKACFVVDKGCSRIVKGFQGGYHYRKVQGKDGRWSEKPNKNHYSHIHDALQYLAQGFQGGYVRDEYHNDQYDDDDEPDIVHSLGF